MGLKDISCLGYVIIREGIKPDPKKPQGIMYIDPYHYNLIVSAHRDGPVL